MSFFDVSVNELQVFIFYLLWDQQFSQHNSSGFRINQNICCFKYLHLFNLLSFVLNWIYNYTQIIALKMHVKSYNLNKSYKKWNSSKNEIDLFCLYFCPQTG